MLEKTEIVVYQKAASKLAQGSQWRQGSQWLHEGKQMQSLDSSGKTLSVWLGMP